MATIHFLNVKQGDCSIIEHNSGRVSVIDVCNAKPINTIESLAEMVAYGVAIREVSGNFHQKESPVNPVAYLHEHTISSIFRYVQTHPDMDHMDGIRALFEAFPPLNFWDTDNTKEMSLSSWSGSPYDQEDWSLYKRLRDSNPSSDPKRLTPLCRAIGKYWNDDDGDGNGDGLHILAPTQDLVDSANDSEDYNDCSYVILYRTGANRIVFGADSHDNTWEHILSDHEKAVTDVDLLIAPHHGRKSGRSYEFLDVLRPGLTFFGNAPSQHLAYSAWTYRNLPYITNNQANCVVVRASESPMRVYVTYEGFARKLNPSTFYDSKLRAWFACDVN